MSSDLSLRLPPHCHKARVRQEATPSTVMFVLRYPQAELLEMSQNHQNLELCRRARKFPCTSNDTTSPNTGTIRKNFYTFWNQERS